MAITRQKKSRENESRGASRNVRLPLSGTKVVRDARMDVRMPRHIKTVVEQAAALTGMNMSDFVLNAVFEAAERRIHAVATTHIKLSNEESQRVAAMLLQPPASSEALIELMKPKE